MTSLSLLAGSQESLMSRDQTDDGPLVKDTGGREENEGGGGRKGKEDGGGSEDGEDGGGEPPLSPRELIGDNVPAYVLACCIRTCITT